MVVKAQKTLISLLSAGILNDSSNVVDPSDIAWDDVIQVAKRNNVFPLLSHTMDWLDMEPSANRQADFKAMRSDCFGRNMAHIAAAIRLSRNFHTHGIDVICIKGTARAYEVYGKWDMRFTHDIDLLVRSRDYREAANVLTSTGYQAPISEHDIWWHEFLGESPYLPAETTGPTVDLHHKLHQPGTPALSELDHLHDNRTMRDLGQFRLPMLDKRDAMMLTATSFGKAIRARQPWLTYAHEIAYARMRDPDMRDAVLDDYAQQCGMKRLWSHAKEASEKMFLEPHAQSIALSSQGTADKEASLNPGPEFLYRSRLLWRWSEGLLTRPFVFLRELLWVNLAELQHDLFANRHMNDAQSEALPNQTRSNR